MNDRFSMDEDEYFQARHTRRIEEMKRRKRKQERFRRKLRRNITLCTGIACVLALVIVCVNLFHKAAGVSGRNKAEIPDKTTEASVEAGSGKSSVADAGGEKAAIEAEQDAASAVQAAADNTEAASEQVSSVYSAKETEDTVRLGGDIISEHAVLVDLNTGSIRASKDMKTAINPASMTKVLTVLVAAEHVTDLDDTFTMTTDIMDYSFVNDCSNVGFDDGETVTVRDLFYGAILPSGGEAALGLAVYVAGSQEAFVKMMNDKLKELGLSGTAHFTNCVGLYDEQHYCTVYDMAMIMKAAVENDFCRQVLSAHIFTTSQTPEHPEGIEISNWFLRRIEDKDSGGEVICGKTGYVVQSGNCAASYARDSAGNGYICVTSNANSGWRCIYDHVALYKRFLPSVM